MSSVFVAGGLDEFGNPSEFIDEEEQETAPLKPSRDPGSWIGNQGWNGVRGDPITGTHFGKLDADGRARRALKSARHRSNRITRAEENKRRGSRA